MLNEMFERLSREKRTAYMPYLCAGDGGLKRTEAYASALIRGGADALELGIPFSDPIADGPVLQAASTRALEQGTTPAGVIATTKNIHKAHPSVPIVIMTYANPIVQMGVTRFMHRLQRAGVSGLLVPDVPFEESDFLREPAIARGVPFLDFVSTTTTPARRKKILTQAEGFVYALAVQGVTGARTSVSQEALSLIHSCTKQTNTPIVAGFGVKTPQQVRAFAKAGAAGVIEGSGLVSFYGRGSTSQVQKRLAGHAKAMQEASMLPP